MVRWCNTFFLNQQSVIQDLVVVCGIYTRYLLKYREDKIRKDSNRLYVKEDNGKGISHTYINYARRPKRCYSEMKRP